MSKVALSLLVLVLVLVMVVATLGVPSRAFAADEAQIGREVAAAMRELLEQVDSGALGEAELARLLLAGLSSTLVRPPVGRLDPPDEALPSVIDEATEQALQASSATTANGAIMIGTTPVATLASPLVIPAAAFREDGAQPASADYSEDGGYWLGTSADYGCLIAAVPLPSGVTVTDMFASVFDNDPSRNMNVTLMRVDNSTGEVASIASAQTTGQVNGWQRISDSSIVTPPVLYPDYWYYLRSCVWSNLFRLLSVRIYFDP